MQNRLKGKREWKHGSQGEIYDKSLRLCEQAEERQGLLENFVEQWTLNARRHQE